MRRGRRGGGASEVGPSSGVVDSRREPSGVDVSGVSKTFGTTTALDRVDFQVREGSFFSLLGPSGCGKTTLLRILAGFETPDCGTVSVKGRDILRTPPDRRPLNLVFQRYALFPHMSVRENIAFGPRAGRMWTRHRQSSQELRRRVDEMIRLVRLEGLGERRPGQLSGGQAQRVALARALINEPPLLLLDEPLSSLDRNVRHLMRDELLRIHGQVGTTFVLVTHDQEEALSMSDEVALMRSGRIEQQGSPIELYRQPKTLFAATFIGSGSVLAAAVVGREDDRVIMQVGSSPCRPIATAGEFGKTGRIFLRPDEVRVGNAANGYLSGPVETCAFLGQNYELRVATTYGVVRVFAENAVASGEVVHVTWNALAGLAYPDAQADEGSNGGGWTRADASKGG